MMKRILYLTASVLASLIVLGCTETSSLEDGSPFLNFNEGQKFSIVLPSTSASGTIEFSTNNSWTATSSEDWLTVSPNSGNGGKTTITISASPNQDTEEREAKITISSQGLSQDITVKQSGFQGFEISQYRFNITGEGGVISIPISANVDYSVEVAEECSSWISIVRTKALNDYTIQVSISENLIPEERTGELTIKYESMSQTVTINQGQGKLVFDSGFAKVLQERGYVLNAEDISYDEVKNIKELYVDNVNLTSLKGIEYFTALTDLICGNNQLTTLDLSKNTALTGLSCSNNQLTTLDLSKNTALTYLYCTDNQLTTLGLSKNTALTDLYCTDNQLTTLDLSKNTALTYLNCTDNQLTSLDVSGRTALKTLLCDRNQLTSLDVSGCTALTYLRCDFNKLTSLEVSGCTALARLDCHGNQLTSLDVSKNTALTYLYCDSNQLTTLDVSKNTALTYLNCTDNQLTSLDVSGCTALRTLLCNGNQLTSLDVSGHTALRELQCRDNQLTSLDISNNTALGYLFCKYNPGRNGIFVVKAWFDNENIPSDAFSDFDWEYNGSTVRIEYQDVVN